MIFSPMQYGHLCDIKRKKWKVHSSMGRENRAYKWNFEDYMKIIGILGIFTDLLMSLCRIIMSAKGLAYRVNSHLRTGIFGGGSMAFRHVT
jgi:hypothetical protein